MVSNSIILSLVASSNCLKMFASSNVSAQVFARAKPQQRKLPHCCEFSDRFLYCFAMIVNANAFSPISFCKPSIFKALALILFSVKEMSALNFFFKVSKRATSSLKVFDCAVVLFNSLLYLIISASISVIAFWRSLIFVATPSSHLPEQQKIKK